MKLFDKSSWLKYGTEAIGTFVLVLFACGAAAVTGSVIVIALAFGLSIVVVGYTFGRFSGTHLNPAVTFAKCLQKEIGWLQGLMYMASQFIGAFLAGLILFIVFRLMGNDYSALGANFTGFWTLTTDASGNPIVDPGRLPAALLVEAILSFVFISVVLFSTDKPNKFAPLIIGGGLTFVHLLGANLPGGTSVNPARSFGVAIWAAINGHWDAAAELVFFIAIPIGAAFLAYLVHGAVTGKRRERNTQVEEPAASAE